MAYEYTHQSDIFDAIVRRNRNRRAVQAAVNTIPAQAPDAAGTDLGLADIQPSADAMALAGKLVDAGALSAQRNKLMRWAAEHDCSPDVIGWIDAQTFGPEVA